MPTIIGISGSLRKGSFNSALLRAAAEKVPQGTRLEIASIAGIPLYNGDVEEAEGIPPAAAKLKDQIAAADGLLLATPEYNNSIPGVFKNAIDWLSRPSADSGRVFGSKPVAIIGASPGAGGTRFSQTAWLPVIRALSLNPWFGKQLYVAGASQAFKDGKLVDEKVNTLLQEFISGFAKFVEQSQRG